MTNDYSLGSVEVALSPLERFEEYLQSRDKRMTRPRKVLVEQIFSRHEHFDADGLMEQMSQTLGADRPKRATVYRCLNELVEAGLLRRFKLGDRDIYEHDYGYPQHDHLHCTECESLIEFQSDELIQLRDAVAAQNRFRVTGHRLIISGVCEECTKAKRRRKRRQDLL